MIPPGYMDTIRTGKNCIQDKNLALYYDKLAFVTQGNLFSWQRIKEIVNLNSGAYDHFLSAYWPEKKR
jgi:arabinofuranosyltransferase